jgi:hypothetical protein
VDTDELEECSGYGLVMGSVAVGNVGDDRNVDATAGSCTAAIAYNRQNNDAISRELKMME